LKFGKQESINL